MSDRATLPRESNTPAPQELGRTARTHLAAMRLELEALARSTNPADRAQRTRQLTAILDVLDDTVRRLLSRFEDPSARERMGNC